MDDENAYLNYKYNLRNNQTGHKVFPIQLRDIKVGDNIYVKYEYSLYRYSNYQLMTIRDSIEFDNEFTINNKLYIVKKNGVIYKAEIDNKNISLLQLLDTYNLTNTDPGNIFGKVKIFQNHSKAPVYLVSGEKIFLLTIINDKIQLNLITDQLPKNEFIKYVQIDNVTKAIYIGTDNRGLLVGRPQYFNRILPNNAIEGVSTSAYAQLQLSNGNIQINTGQIYGKSKIVAANVFYRPSETSTFISKDSFKNSR
jgi:hypothetical protein